MTFFAEKMPAFMRGNSMPLSRLIPALILCVLLQLQVTLFKSEGYMGLRLNAADFILPLLGLFIMGRIFLRKDQWPQWRVPHLYALLAALTALLSFALYNGYQYSGSLDSWALVNKYAGWFILLGYLGVGGWIGSRPYQEWLPVILRVFALLWGATYIGFSILLFIIDSTQGYEVFINHYPLEGFMGNRNAFAFLSFSMLALVSAWQMRQPERPRWYFILLWAFVPLFYIYNASRSLLFILPLIVPVFLLLHTRFTLRWMIVPMLAGGLVTFLLFALTTSQALNITKWHTQNAAHLISATDNPHDRAIREKLYVGDQIRSKTYGDAWAVFQEHKVLGGGLGAYRHYQIQTRGEFLDVVDCTPLWLLAETGLLGFGIFAALFITALWRLFLMIRRGEDPEGIYLGIFLMMVIFAVMSLVHELLYTRFLWFFMGLGIALPLSSCQRA